MVLTYDLTSRLPLCCVTCWSWHANMVDTCIKGVFTSVQAMPLDSKDLILLSHSNSLKFNMATTVQCGTLQ